MCGEKASYSTVERVGQCFVCGRITKLHSKYDDIPVDALFSDLPQHFRISTRKKRDRVEIVTRPLSQQSISYITSRGIHLEVVQRFGLLEETTYHGGIYLAWSNQAGNYEIRATFQTEKYGKMTPAGQDKHFTLAKLVPEASTCIVCEGIFSALAYAQLCNRYDVWYVILNSTANRTKLITELVTFKSAGIKEFILALDHDQAGLKATVALSQALSQVNLPYQIELPDEEGEDWNDALIRKNTERSLARLSVPDEPKPLERPALSVAYYEELLNCHDKVVIAAPCGLGKTYTAAEYMATHWSEGILYVAERNEQLLAMQRLLIKFGVPPEVIGTYYSGSEDLKALRQSGVWKAIALVTHARMQAFPPQEYMLMHKQGGAHQRRLMIVDESICPLLILKVPEIFVKGLLGEMGLRFEDMGKLDPVEMECRIARIDHLLRRHAQFSLKKVGIEAEYIAWTDALPPIDSVIEARGFAYYSMVYQLLSGTYITGDEDIRVLVPMTPHLSWVQAFDQILVLDATAQITDYLYQDYTIVQPGTWNYADVTLGYKVLSGIGDLTKTAMQRYKESFLEDLRTNVRHIFDLGDFNDPYVVTFKTFEDDVRSLLATEVSHYGETRGSNAFKQRDSAVLLGAYRPPVSFDKLAQLLFRETYSPYKFAVAHWIQEMYRTRIRQGEPINLLVMGERQAIEHFQKAINTTLWPSVIGADDPEVRERTLQNLKSKTGYPRKAGHFVSSIT
jgi:hypothetical protein